LVRGGGDFRFPEDIKARSYGHTLPNVYGEMMMQVAMDFPSLPDVRSMTLSDIRYWFNGLRAALKKRTAPRQ
jgi:hypothetical protein